MTKFKTAVMKYRAVPVATGLMTVVASFPALASETTGNAASDVSLMVDVVKGVMGLFSTYPLNIFIAGAVALVGFRVFRGGKKAAK